LQAAHLSPVGELHGVILLLHDVLHVHLHDGLHRALGQEERDDVLRSFLQDLVVGVPERLGEHVEQGGVLLRAPGGVDGLGEGEQLHHRLHELRRQVLPVCHLGEGGWVAKVGKG